VKRPGRSLARKPILMKTQSFFNLKFISVKPDEMRMLGRLIGSIKIFPEIKVGLDSISYSCKLIQKSRKNYSKPLRVFYPFSLGGRKNLSLQGNS